MAQSMKHQHTTEVPIGSKLFKWIQEMIDETCLTKMCGYGRDMRHKQSTKQKKKRIPYNRLEAVRVYQLNNSLRRDIYNANKSMIFKYSQKQVPDDSETEAAKSKKYKTISVVKQISDSVVTTKCRLSRCSLQRDVNEVLLFHGTAGGIVPMIVDDGIDEHYSKLNGLFGAGAYFTDRSNKADQYVTPVPFEIIQELDASCDRNRAAASESTLGPLDTATPENEGETTTLPDKEDEGEMTAAPHTEDEGEMTAAPHTEDEGESTSELEKQDREEIRVPLAKDDVVFPMFVCRVALGDPVGTPSDPVEPEAVDRLATKMNLTQSKNLFRTASMVAERWGKRFINGERKHSVIGRGKAMGVSAQDGLEYVVYEKAQSHPEYLVFYKRTILDDVNDTLTGWFVKKATGKSFSLGLNKKRFFVLSKSKRTISYYQDETRAVLKNTFFIKVGSRLERDEKTKFFTIIKPSGTKLSAKMLDDNKMYSTQFIEWIIALNELCTDPATSPATPGSLSPLPSPRRTPGGESVSGDEQVASSEAVLVDGASQQKARNERRWNDFRLFVGKQWCKFRPWQLEEFKEQRPKHFVQDKDQRWFYVTTAIHSPKKKPDEELKNTIPLLPVGVAKPLAIKRSKSVADIAKVSFRKGKISQQELDHIKEITERFTSENETGIEQMPST